MKSLILLLVLLAEVSVRADLPEENLASVNSSPEQEAPGHTQGDQDLQAIGPSGDLAINIQPGVISPLMQPPIIHSTEPVQPVMIQSPTLQPMVTQLPQPELNSPLPIDNQLQPSVGKEGSFGNSSQSTLQSIGLASSLAEVIESQVQPEVNQSNDVNNDTVESTVNTLIPESSRQDSPIEGNKESSREEGDPSLKESLIQEVTSNQAELIFSSQERAGDSDENNPIEGKHEQESLRESVLEAHASSQDGGTRSSSTDENMIPQEVSVGEKGENKKGPSQEESIPEGNSSPQDEISSKEISSHEVQEVGEMSMRESRDSSDKNVSKSSVMGLDEESSKSPKAKEVRSGSEAQENLALLQELPFAHEGLETFYSSEDKKTLDEKTSESTPKTSHQEGISSESKTEVKVSDLPPDQVQGGGNDRDSAEREFLNFLEKAKKLESLKDFHHFYKQLSKTVPELSPLAEALGKAPLEQKEARMKIEKTLKEKVKDLHSGMTMEEARAHLLLPEESQWVQEVLSLASSAQEKSPKISQVKLQPLSKVQFQARGKPQVFKEASGKSRLSNRVSPMRLSSIKSLKKDFPSWGKTSGVKRGGFHKPEGFNKGGLRNLPLSRSRKPMGPKLNFSLDDTKTPYVIRIKKELRGGVVPRIIQEVAPTQVQRKRFGQNQGEVRQVGRIFPGQMRTNKVVERTLLSEPLPSRKASYIIQEQAVIKNRPLPLQKNHIPQPSDFPKLPYWIQYFESSPSKVKWAAPWTNVSLTSQIRKALRGPDVKLT